MNLQPLPARKYSKIEWTLLGSVLCLMVVGLLFVYSSTYNNDVLHNLYLKQLIWYFVGTVAACLCCLVDYHVLARWSFVSYWFTIFLLLTVMVVGQTVLGAKRWINLGLFKLQPSEFAKLAFILAMGHFLSRPVDELKQPRNFIKSIGMVALPFLLILVEPDLGSALVFLPVALMMFFVGGVPRRYLVQVVALSVGLVSLVLVDILFLPTRLQFVKLHRYQQERLLTFFGKDFAPSGASEAEKQQMRVRQRDKSYNVEQALISVGSGGLTGKGWRQGKQIALGYLPRAVAHNDFIFSVIAEEEGFVGSVIVITLYAIVLFCGIKVAGEARDRLGKLLAVGVVSLFFGHIFINIGMNIRIVPVTGVPLPLLSYGGSSVICSLVAIGILQNVYMYRRAY
ncbi:MAG: Cell cycle protein [Verrucomicrobiales bacterium]|nr:Cell cycle protein [Verrucomicrobiales bacterium]